jgi:5'(3')-deoxyribonucleotidase
MVITIDIDGVLLDYRQKWYDVYQSFNEAHDHKKDLDPIDTWQWDHILHTCPKCFEDMLSNSDHVKDYILRPNVEQTLKKLVNMNHALYSVTSRMDNKKHFTDIWMRKNKISQYFTRIIFTQDKPSVLNELKSSYHIEDSPDIIESVKKSCKTIPIIYDMPWNKDVEGMRVYNWYELDNYFSLLT